MAWQFRSFPKTPGRAVLGELDWKYVTSDGNVTSKNATFGVKAMQTLLTCMFVWTSNIEITYHKFLRQQHQIGTTNRKQRKPYDPKLTCKLHFWPPIGMLPWLLFHWTSDPCAMTGWVLGPNLRWKFWRRRCPCELPPNGFRRRISNPRLSTEI